LAIEPHELGRRRQAAEAIAREAGAAALLRFRDRSSFTVGLKGPQDYLTEVDGEVERLIAARLHALFPDDGFVGEEGEARQAAPGAPTWVVDPIDGTANFARGVPHFCISIALISGNALLAGAIFDPAMDEMFVGEAGGGAFLNGQPMRVAATSDMRQAAIEVGWNMRAGPDKYIRLLSRIVAAGSAVMRCGSGALALAYVAAGRSDGFVEHHINAWDCLAGNVMVAEAGGYVSDFLGRDGLRRGGPLLACTPALRDPLAGLVALEGVEL